MKVSKKIKTDVTISLTKKDIDKIMQNSTEEYDGKIYTEKEINDYIKEVLECSNIPKTWKEPLNEHTNETNEMVLGLVLFDMINNANMAKKYGMDIYKIWSCANDERSCPICRAMDGVKVPIGEPFPNEVYVPEFGTNTRWGIELRDKQGRSMKCLCPPIHNGCRCAILTDIEN